MTKKQELHEILDLYLPSNFPNKGALERRLLALMEEKS